MSNTDGALNLIDLVKRILIAAAAREYLESLLWPAMSKRKPEKHVVPPIDEKALEEIRRRTAEARAGVPGLDSVVTVDSVAMTLPSATPAPPKTPKR